MLKVRGTVRVGFEMWVGVGVRLGTDTVGMSTRS